jgi:hypothetical protein
MYKKKKKIEPKLKVTAQFNFHRCIECAAEN